jgi:hypothetical protein
MAALSKAVRFSLSASLSLDGGFLPPRWQACQAQMGRPTHETALSQFEHIPRLVKGLCWRLGISVCESARRTKVTPFGEIYFSGQLPYPISESATHKSFALTILTFVSGRKERSGWSRGSLPMKDAPALPKAAAARASRRPSCRPG